MKGKIFVNSIDQRHRIVRISKSGNKVTATNLADNEDYVFYFDVPKMKFIKAYTKDIELGVLEKDTPDLRASHAEMLNALKCAYLNCHKSQMTIEAITIIEQAIDNATNLP